MSTHSSAWFFPAFALLLAGCVHPAKSADDAPMEIPRCAPCSDPPAEESACLSGHEALASTTESRAVSTCKDTPETRLALVRCVQALSVLQNACKKDKSVPKRTEEEVFDYCVGAGITPGGRVVVDAILRKKSASCKEINRAAKEAAK